MASVAMIEAPWERPSRLVAGRLSSVDRTDGLVIAYFLGLAGLVLFPLLRPGFLLSLDMVSSPNVDRVGYLLSAKDPLYYGRLPIVLFLDAVGLVLPQWVVQRLIVAAIVAGSGLSAYAASRSRTTAAALFAGTLYAVNPFVYVRLLAGHTWFLLGYAVLPLAVVAFSDALADRRHVPRAAAWTTLASAVDPHVAVVAAVAFGGIGATTVLDGTRPRTTVVNAARFGALTAALNAYWLLPAFSTLGAGTSKVASIGALDLVAFAPRGTIAGNVPLSVAMLFGFWRGGYRLPTALVPFPLYVLAFAGLLFVVVSGLSARTDRPLETGLAVGGLAGFVLALGVGVDATAPLFRALFEHVVVFRGMRDSQKFVALLALSYAMLGAGGIDRLVRRADDRLGADPLARDVIASGLPSRATAVRGLLLLAILLAPLAYAWPMLGGFAGQLSATEYPEEWHEANEHVTADPGPGRVLFLPWHQYLTFPWTDGRVANPADAFFERPVIRSHSIDHGGIESQAPSPAHAAVDSVLDDPSAAEPLGAALAPIGVKYVVVATVADHDRHATLRSQPDLAVALENERLVVYENLAFDGASRDHWPRSRPVLPRRALAAGTLASLGALVWCRRSGPSRAGERG